MHFLASFNRDKKRQTYDKVCDKINGFIADEIYKLNSSNLLTKLKNSSINVRWL